MRRQGGRLWGLVALAAGVFVIAAGGVALGAARIRNHRGLSSARVLAAQSGARVRVIVLLRNQHTGLPATRSLIRARAAQVESDQSPLEATVRATGGTVTNRYRTINAFAALVTKAERARLAANRNVAAVLPDVLVAPPSESSSAAIAQPSAPAGAQQGAQGSQGGQQGASQGGSQSGSISASAGNSDPGSGTGVATGSGQICGTATAPILAPEGLSLIQAPQAQQIVTGAGVKVAFVADGIDVDNPDFIRPDGSHVIVDYRDFTGQGPNAPTTGEEAFGDASTIAAQGAVTYDLSQYSNSANALPSPCDIILRGVAPGASLVAMKVFPTVNGQGGDAFISTILQGMDWAVSVDHVNVLNESFGGDTLPDTAADAVKQFNILAQDAGVVVTVSSGDEGISNTIGTPASGPAGISAGSTTQFQGLAQTTRGGFQLSTSHDWLNDNIATFSSSGFTQAGTTLDLVAPGNESFETCTPTAVYADCVNLNGGPSNIRTFGGTSESAPMTAGVAALVIEAYRNTHDGATPSPVLVKQIILSSADDLNIPSDEQGAGELNALAAVQAAESIGNQPVGDGRLVSPSQLDFASQPGTQNSGAVTVTNDGAATETISARLRTLGAPTSIAGGDATLDPATDPTFTDYVGVAQAYTKLRFKVPAGADQLNGTIAWPGVGDSSGVFQTVNMTLFDPSGNMAAFTYEPNGAASNYGHLDVRNPAPGTWTAYIFTPAGTTAATKDESYTGPVHYALSTASFVTLGSVSPSSVTLAPGQSAPLQVTLGTPAAAGDYSRDLQMTGSSGKTTVVPIVVRSLVPLAGGGGSFAGSLAGGNANTIGSTNTFAFDVPSGAPALNVQFTLPSDPGTTIFNAILVSPEGQALAQQVPATNLTSGAETMQLFKQDPEPGVWRFSILTLLPAGGTTINGGFTGTVSLLAPPVSAFGVPDSAFAAIPRGGSVTAHVRVTNNGNAPMSVFIDPRRTQQTYYPLLSLTPATGLALPLNPLALPPLFIIPTETSSVVAAAQATGPVTFDWGPGDPDLIASSHGDSASGVISASEVAAGLWALSPSLLGPFSGPASGTVNTGMVALTRAFDASVSSPTGDVELYYVEPNAPTPTPLTLSPGQSSSIPVTFTATDRRGTIVTGDLFVDDSVAADGSANELRVIPYAYRIR